MKLIPLTRGKFAAVDEADYIRVCKLSWQAQKIKLGWVVKRGVWNPEKKNNCSQPLSLFILEAPVGTRIDHINGDPFDNRRENLRVCTKTENDRAFRRKALGKSSRFRGVSWMKNRACWVAAISTGGKYFYLGLFDIETDAARAYDAAAREMFGEFACPNFPITKSVLKSN